MDQIISTKILRNVVFFFAEFQNLFVLPLGVFGLCVVVLFSPLWDFCCQLLIGLHFTGHECVCKPPYDDMPVSYRISHHACLVTRFWFMCFVLSVIFSVCFERYLNLLSSTDSFLWGWVHLHFPPCSPFSIFASRIPEPRPANLPMVAFVWIETLFWFDHNPVLAILYRSCCGVVQLLKDSCKYVE